jgi:hypothetical protein
MIGNTKARVIAYYLPQFHPIPENNKWWGNGFTEWTNVGKAKPLFKGHYQPRIPADLGYYDLRMSETREMQAKLARDHGVEGFCYWHYWFGNGKQLLERPFNEVLASGKPDFPFCLGWANHSWTNSSWNKHHRWKEDMILMEQTYPGEEEHVAHFYEVLKAFNDPRYIKVDGEPIFVIFKPLDIPSVSSFVRLWKNLAKQNGLKGIHFIGITSNSSNYYFNQDGQKKFKVAGQDESTLHYQNTLNLGFDAVNSRGLLRAQIISQGKYMKLLNSILKKTFGLNFIDKHDYKSLIKHFYVNEDSWENVYPTIMPQYDRSPRSGKKANIVHNSSPYLFKKNIENALNVINGKDPEHKILFLQSWNEWAEGNYVEPDLKFGHGYLEALREVILFS